MNSNQTQTVYTSVGGTGNANGASTRSSRPKTRSRLHDYRPIPLRLPFLFSFVTLSAAYIVLIELLLHYARGLPASSNEDGSQRLFRRQTDGLSTSTVYVTSTAVPVIVTVSITDYAYTTLYPTTYTGTEITTVTLSSSASSSKPSITSASSTSSSPPTVTKSLSIITSGQTSYYVTTSTAVVSLPGATVTVSLKTLQTVLIFSKPTSSKASVESTVLASVLPSSKSLDVSPMVAISQSQPVSSQLVSSSIIVRPTSILPSSQALAITSVTPVQSSTPSGAKTTTYSGMTIASSSVLNFAPATSATYLPASQGLTFLSGSSSSIPSTTSSPKVSHVSDSSVILSFISSSTIQRSSLSLFSSTTSTSVTAAPTANVLIPIPTSQFLPDSMPSSLVLSFFSSSATLTPSQTSPYAAFACYANSALCTASNSQINSISDGQVQPMTSYLRLSSSLLQSVSEASITNPSSSAGAVTSSTRSIPQESALVLMTFATTASTAPSTNSVLQTDSRSTTYFSITVAQSTSTTSSISRVSSNVTSTSVPLSEPTFVLATTERLVQGTFNMGYYVSALYVPALLAIIIKGLWEIVFASTRLMQPFERMATRNGVSGRYSIFAQYLSSSLSLDVVRAIGHGNPIPLLAELSYVLVQIGTPIAAIATTVKPRSRCEIGNNRVPCDPVWIIDVPLLRVIEGILGLCLLCVLVILFMRARHRSGVDSDPSSLGSIAHITNEENLLATMQACAIDDEPVLFEQLLRKQHFRLTEYSDKVGYPRYGIINVRGATDILSRLNQVQAYPGYHTVAGPGLPSLESPTLMSAARSPILSPAREAILLDFFGLLAPVALLTIIVSFWLDGNLDDAWNRFFLTPSIWPKLLLVGLATASSILVTNIERIVRIIEPFRRLNTNSRTERSAPPATTLLISRSGTAYSTLVQCVTLLLRYEHCGGRMGFQFLVALAVVISDLNIVAVAGIAWTEATTQASFQLSMIISMALTSFVILVWLIVIFWWRRHRAVQVLRSSNGAGNVAGTMRYLSCGSKEIVGEVARMYEEWYILGSKSRYAGQWHHYRAVFGQHVCDDQKVRWCVSLQKIAPEFDEVQDVGERDPRLRYS